MFLRRFIAQGFIRRYHSIMIHAWRQRISCLDFSFRDLSMLPIALEHLRPDHAHLVSDDHRYASNWAYRHSESKRPPCAKLISLCRCT